MSRWFALALLLAPPLHAAVGGTTWIRISTPHFEMYSTNSAADSIEELRIFEQVRYFFLRKNGSRLTDVPKARIIAFKSESEYAPYAFSQGAFAYYERTPKADYIVLQDIRPDHREAAIHEYAHLILSHQGAKLPVWLNEGLADLYSSLESEGTQAVIGRPLPGRMYALRTEPWIPLDLLFAVDENSPYYNGGERMSAFYAESWALVHMLRFGDQYSANFGRFLSAILAGSDAEDALASAFGKRPQEVYRDLQQYVCADMKNTAVYNIEIQDAGLQARIDEPPDFDVALALAGLLAFNRSKQAAGMRMLDELASRYSARPEPDDTLGYALWEQGDREGARAHFARAVERGSHDVRMLSDYAVLENAAIGPTPEVLHLLQAAMQLDPDNYATRLRLGLLAFNARQMDLALQVLSSLREVDRRDAFSVFVSLAYIRAHFDDMAGAKTYAEKALRYASCNQQREQAQEVLDFAVAHRPHVLAMADVRNCP
jgi:hypothetical protein